MLIPYFPDFSVLLQIQKQNIYRTVLTKKKTQTQTHIHAQIHTSISHQQDNSYPKVPM